MPQDSLTHAQLGIPDSTSPESALGSSRVKFGAGLTTTHLEYDDTIQICALDAIPYILVFDRNVVRIELRLLNRRAVYVRAEIEQLDTGSQLTVIGGSSPRFKR